MKAYCHNYEINPVHLKTKAVLIKIYKNLNTVNKFIFLPVFYFHKIKLYYTYKDILSPFLIIMIMIITQK